MRKEYRPAIALYAVSALLLAAAVVGYIVKMKFATPCLLCGIFVHLFASARLTKIGRALREQLTPAEPENESDGERNDEE